MGYAVVIGSCYGCGVTMGFNPTRVPSIRDRNGVRQPVCAGCIERANVKRREMGLEPLTYAPDAYEPVDENELGE